MAFSAPVSGTEEASSSSSQSSSSSWSSVMVSIWGRDCTSLIWAESSLSTTSTLDISLFFWWKNERRRWSFNLDTLGVKRGGGWRRAHLLSVHVARRYGDHRRLAYEPGQEGPDPERGPVNPETPKESRVS